MSSVAQALRERWFVHKCAVQNWQGASRNADNQPITTYHSPSPIPLCRLQDLSSEEIRTITESGVINASHKLLVPVYKDPPLHSKIEGIYQNGLGYDSFEDEEVDIRPFEIVASYVRRSYSDDYRQLILRRIG
jgi:hypothetical protein